MKVHDSLVAAAQKGQQYALEELLQVSQPNIRRIARVQCSTSSDIDDAVQETLLLVYRHIGALRTIASFSSWVFSIVRRECQKLARHERELARGMPPDDHHAFIEKPALELRADLVADIHSLPEKYREVIVLRDVVEFSISEIASELLLTRGAVKSGSIAGDE